MCTWSSSPSYSPRETCPQSLRHGQVSVQLCLLSKKWSQICVMSQAHGSSPDLFYRAWPQTCYFRLNLMPLWLAEIETLPQQWKLLGEKREHRVSLRLVTEQSVHCHHLWHFSSQEEECREIMNSYEILAKDQPIMCTNPTWIQRKILLSLLSLTFCAGKPTFSSPSLYWLDSAVQVCFKQKKTVMKAQGGTASGLVSWIFIALLGSRWNLSLHLQRTCHHISLCILCMLKA